LAWQDGQKPLFILSQEPVEMMENHTVLIPAIFIFALQEDCVT
jgi:hypothetical protein